MVHIITTLSHSYLACWAARFSIRYKTRKKNFKTIRIFWRPIAILGVGNLILKLAKYSFKLRDRSHNASRDLGDFGPHPLHVTLFPILLSWIVKLSLTPAPPPLARDVPYYVNDPRLSQLVPTSPATTTRRFPTFKILLFEIQGSKVKNNIIGHSSPCDSYANRSALLSPIRTNIAFRLYKRKGLRRIFK